MCMYLHDCVAASPDAGAHDDACLVRLFTAAMDIGLAVYQRSQGVETGVGYAAHLGGAVAGACMMSRRRRV